MIKITVSAFEYLHHIVWNSVTDGATHAIPNAAVVLITLVSMLGIIIQTWSVKDIID